VPFDALTLARASIDAFQRVNEKKRLTGNREAHQVWGGDAWSKFELKFS